MRGTEGVSHGGDGPLDDQWWAIKGAACFQEQIDPITGNRIGGENWQECCQQYGKEPEDVGLKRVSVGYAFGLGTEMSIQSAPKIKFFSGKD